MNARPLPGTLAALGLTLVLGATACGGSDSDGGDAAAQTGGDAQQVQTLVEKTQQAVADGDSEFVCANITDAARTAAVVRVSGQEGAGTCQRSFDDLAAARVEERPLPRVTDVSVDGDTAQVTLEQEDGTELQLTAVEEKGAWKLRLLIPGDTRPTNNPDFRPPVPEGEE